MSAIIHICKASPITGDQKTNSITICIDKEFSFSNMSLKQCAQFYDEQAEELYNALVSSLPQGTLEPLMVKLMQGRISLYRGTMK